MRPPVLIPRPETEELVELILNDTQLEKERNVRFIDIGCGSGAILLAILKARPCWSGIAIDPVEKAVELCRENARLLKVEKRCEVFQSSIEDWTYSRQRALCDFVVSNPPYIPRNDLQSLEPEVILHEDYNALYGGADGLDVVREVLARAPSLVKTKGNIWLEVDSSHPAEISRLMENSSHHNKALCFEKAYHDFQGHERFCKISIR